MVKDNKNRDNPEKEFVEEEASLENQAAGAGQNLLLEASKEELIEEINRLGQELVETRLKSDEYLDGWQRSRAEFANYRKRVERDRQQIYQDVASDIIRRYLDVIDDLERALKNKPEHGEGAEWAVGIELIFRKMLIILESEGVEPMQAQGSQFDPNLHEAISQEEHPAFESGQIIEVVKTGYFIGERVLRPAAVRVAQ